MSKISGKGGKVYYGSVIVAEQVEWSMSGFAMPTIKKDAAFQQTIDEYEAVGCGDPGTISFSGNWDPSDAQQVALHTACAAGTHVTNLYLYANTSTFWHVGVGGFILVTKSQAITLPRSGFGKITFEGQVSDAAMAQAGTGT